MKIENYTAAKLKTLIDKKKKEIAILREALVKVEMRESKERKIKRDLALLKLPEETFVGVWKEALESGILPREVAALQNLDIHLRVLGPMLGVCASRARQIREKAKRRLRHPSRYALAVKLNLLDKISS